MVTVGLNLKNYRPPVNLGVQKKCSENSATADSKIPEAASTADFPLKNAESGKKLKKTKLEEKSRSLSFGLVALKEIQKLRSKLRSI